MAAQRSDMAAILHTVRKLNAPGYESPTGSTGPSSSSRKDKKVQVKSQIVKVGSKTRLAGPKPAASRDRSRSDLGRRKPDSRSSRGRDRDRSSRSTRGRSGPRRSSRLSPQPKFKPKSAKVQTQPKFKPKSGSGARARSAPSDGRFSNLGARRYGHVSDTTLAELQADPNISALYGYVIYKFGINLLFKFDIYTVNLVMVLCITIRSSFYILFQRVWVRMVPSIPK